MKLADLKQGMVCELRNGNRLIVLNNDTEKYYYDERLGATFTLNYHYNDDLTQINQKGHDIIKVTFGNDVIYERQESNLFFEPNKGEAYYYVNHGSVWTYENNESKSDNKVLRTNIVFKTREEAEKELLRQQAKIRVIKEIARLNEGWTPNWNDNENKHHIEFSYYRNKLVYNSCVKSKHLDNNLYLKTDYVASQLIETHSDDLKLMLEVE